MHVNTNCKSVKFLSPFFLGVGYDLPFVATGNVVGSNNLVPAVPKNGNIWKFKTLTIQVAINERKVDILTNLV